MRRKSSIAVIGIVVLLCGTIGSSVRAQQPYSIVYDLYYELMQYPEFGDSIIANNQNVFDNRFHQCLSVLTQRWAVHAQEYYQFCNQVHIDPNMAANCYQGNEPAKMLQWLNDTRMVTRGQIRWSDTLIGQGAMMGKQLVPTYLEIVREMVPPWRPYLLCQ